MDRIEGRVFSSHDCPAPKPAPDVYLKAADAAGMSPAQCVVVEDSASGAKAVVPTRATVVVRAIAVLRNMVFSSFLVMP